MWRSRRVAVAERARGRVVVVHGTVVVQVAVVVDRAIVFHRAGMTDPAVRVVRVGRSRRISMAGCARGRAVVVHDTVGMNLAGPINCTIILHRARVTLLALTVVGMLLRWRIVVTSRAGRRGIIVNRIVLVQPALSIDGAVVAHGSRMALPAVLAVRVVFRGRVPMAHGAVATRPDGIAISGTDGQFIALTSGQDRKAKAKGSDKQRATHWSLHVGYLSFITRRAL